MFSSVVVSAAGVRPRVIELAAEWRSGPGLNGLLASAAEALARLDLLPLDVGWNMTIPCPGSAA